MIFRNWLLTDEGNKALTSLTRFVPTMEAEAALLAAWDTAIVQASRIAGSAAERPYNDGEAFDCATFIEAEIWKLRAVHPVCRSPERLF